MSTASWPAASRSSRMGALSGKPAWSEAMTMRMGGDHTQAGRWTGRMCLHKAPTHRYSRANLRHGQGEEVVRSRGTGPTRAGPRPSVVFPPHRASGDVRTRREVRSLAYTDRGITCLDCGVEFVFTAGEQEFYAQRGFSEPPKRCPSCRATRKAQRSAGGSG